MAPPNLQGLNIIHPAPQSNSQDLLSGPPFPDLSAQLDLWTNLAFDTDEGPLGSRNDEHRRYSSKNVGEEEEEDIAHSPVTGEKAIHDGHVNVVTGTNVGTNQPPPAFDLSAFLAGFGIDPYSQASLQQSSPGAIAPSIAQLLALQSHGNPYSASAPPALPPHYPASDRNTSYTRASAEPAEEPYPPAKRSRTRKSSISSVASPEDYREQTPNPSNPSLSAAEDKRRRNTAASARFRLKKKEREAALEGKAKELETRVNELERECEGLRRENGWLKGLVVGVTGAAQGPVIAPQSITPPPSNAAVATGTKRSRDEAD